MMLTPLQPPVKLGDCSALKQIIMQRSAWTAAAPPRKSAPHIGRSPGNIIPT